MAHTPGPWVVLDAGQSIVVGGGPNNDDIASFFHRDEDTVTISREEALSNAALCAAAADLLEAAKTCLAAEKARRLRLRDGAPATTYSDHRIAMIEAAIAKATGKAA